jgi:ketosteroid isomerase-like protein
MSQENVELVMESFRRFEANDVQGYAALWHPEGRGTAPADWPEPGPFVGRDAVVAQFERLAADWAITASRTST